MHYTSSRQYMWHYLVVSVGMIIGFFSLAHAAHAVTYQVTSCAELGAINDLLPLDPTDEVVLGASFSCDVSIGSDVTPFNAIFDGRGHQIELTGNVPLFEETDGATIRRLSLAGDIDGGDELYGASVVRFAGGGTLIEQVVSRVALTNVASYSGGFVSILNDSTIRDSAFEGSIESDGVYTAGIVAMMINGSILERVFVSGAITGGSNTGGLVGFMNRDGGPQVVRDSFKGVGNIVVLEPLLNPYGAIAGLLDNALNPEVGDWLVNNYYDAEYIPDDICAPANPNDVTSSAGICEAINTDEVPDPFYFFDNEDNPPLDTWDFTTVWFSQVPYPMLRSVIAPLVETLSPLDGSQDVATNFEISLTFDRPIAFGSGTINIVESATDEVVVSIAVGGGDFAETRSVQFLEELEYDTEYYITVSEQAFIDENDFYFAGFDDPVYWNFRTEAAPIEPERESRSSSSRITYGCKDPDASNYTQFARHDEGLCVYEESIAGEDVSSKSTALVATPMVTLVAETPKQETALTIDWDTVSLTWLMQGDRGDTVAALQQILNTLGGALVVDGVFGSITEQTVRAFQADHELVVDGVVGPQTWAKLQSLTVN